MLFYKKMQKKGDDFGVCCNSHPSVSADVGIFHNPCENCSPPRLNSISDACPAVWEREAQAGGMACASECR